jgi:NAD-dependent dihydropyrimidine dehydrogenase PreA subunit
MRVEVDKDKCTGCGECREACPKGPVIWKINGKAEATNLRYCHVCTLCASKCPQKAIKVIRDGDDGKDEKIKQEN